MIAGYCVSQLNPTLRRKIWWLWSTTGGAGKTVLAHWLKTHLKNTNLLNAGSVKDNALRINPTDRLWVIDLTQNEKNGMGPKSELVKLLEIANSTHLHADKYYSYTMAKLPLNCIVMGNEPPPYYVIDRCMDFKDNEEKKRVIATCNKPL